MRPRIAASARERSTEIRKKAPRPTATQAQVLMRAFRSACTAWPSVQVGPQPLSLPCSQTLSVGPGCKEGRRGLVLVISAAVVFATAARPTAGERQTALHNGWIATPGTSSRAVEAPSAVSVTRTYIYPKGSYRWFSVTCPPNPPWGLECDANWGDPGLGFWALRLNPRTWVSGFESVRPAHFSAHARRRTLRPWSVAGWGTIRFHSPGRWDVYRGKRLAAYTRGPQGVAAGFLWLQTTRPLHSRSTLDSRRAISG